MKTVSDRGLAAVMRIAYSNSFVGVMVKIERNSALGRGESFKTVVAIENHDCLHAL